MISEFGFTNDIEYYNKAVAFREAAILDNWKIEATYKNESETSHATLMKDGYKMFICTRKGAGKWLYEVNINIWAPDRLHIIPPEKYDWNKIQQGIKHCNECGKDDTDTFRYSFAGRCCKECLPKMQKIHEAPGWCD